ncbi:MAG: hypothetical protein RL181_1002 [Bacteroidota bacterium]|jgi:ribonuclease P protein component
MSGFKFEQKEHLKSHKMIGELFKSGDSFGMYPLRAVWKTAEQKEGNCPLKISISVPKKRFRRAVARNRLRRQVREAFRLSRAAFVQNAPADHPPVALMILYTGVEALPYAVIQEAMARLLKRLAKEIRKEKP